MGLFEGIENASISEGGNWLTEGTYKLEIEKVICKKRTKPGKTGHAYIVEFLVLESDGPKANRKGSKTSYTTTSDKTMYLGNIKAFISAAMNCNAKEVTEEDAELTCHEKNPLKGKIVLAEAFNTVKQDGGPFTKIKFSPNVVE